MDKVTLAADPVWPGRFEDERERIRDAAGNGLLGVFHVGSTAIPDLAAKPALDVLAVFAGYEPARATADELVEVGYELGRDDPEFVQLTRWGDEFPVFLQARPRDAEGWRDQLVFREYLRETPEARREYERVKRDAAATHPDDPTAYTDAKREVVDSLTERAYDRGCAEGLPAFARRTPG